MKFESVRSREKQIGVGSYKRAYLIESGGRPEVRLVFKQPYTDNEIKGLLYLNKVATKLFPGRIARIRQAGNVQTSTGVSTQAIAEFIEHDPAHAAIKDEALKFDGKAPEFHPMNEEEKLAYERFLELRQQSAGALNRPDVKDFLKQYGESGLVAGLGHFIKWEAQDLIQREDGSFVFIDIDRPWQGRPFDTDSEDELGDILNSNDNLRFNPEKLLASIEHMEDSRAKSEAMSAYERLLTLAREEGYKI